MKITVGKGTNVARRLPNGHVGARIFTKNVILAYDERFKILRITFVIIWIFELLPKMAMTTSSLTISIDPLAMK
jgi:hypothetical protein